MIHNYLLVSIIIIFCTSSLQAQDLFDEENTRKYAKYLYQRGNYQLAIPEYERLIFFNPDENEYKIQLLDSYFKSEAYGKVEGSISEWYPDRVSFPFSLFYLKTKLKIGEFQTAQQVLADERFQFPADEKPAYQVVSYALANEWDKAAELCESTTSAYQSQSFEQYCLTIASVQGFRPKSKPLAAGLSILLPGLGKVYTKDYVDAAVNFLFIGITAYQAYRGFGNEEINDIQGWIYGGVALSFYLGNIYGSWRAADQYNYRFYESKRQALDRDFFSL